MALVWLTQKGPLHEPSHATVDAADENITRQVIPVAVSFAVALESAQAQRHGRAL